MPKLQLKVNAIITDEAVVGCTIFPTAPTPIMVNLEPSLHLTLYLTPVAAQKLESVLGEASVDYYQQTGKG